MDTLSELLKILTSLMLFILSEPLGILIQYFFLLFISTVFHIYIENVSGRQSKIYNASCLPPNKQKGKVDFIPQDIIYHLIYLQIMIEGLNICLGPWKTCTLPL